MSYPSASQVPGFCVGVYVERYAVHVERTTLDDAPHLPGGHPPDAGPPAFTYLPHI